MGGWVGGFPWISLVCLPEVIYRCAYTYTHRYTNLQIYKNIFNGVPFSPLKYFMTDSSGSSEKAHLFLKEIPISHQRNLDPSSTGKSGLHTRKPLWKKPQTFRQPCPSFGL